GGQAKVLHCELARQRNRARLVLHSPRGADCTPPVRATTGILPWRLAQAVLVEHHAQYSEADNASEICSVLSFPVRAHQGGRRRSYPGRWLGWLKG
ncbi:MAG: hypothetical protein D6758_08525, partial [Gammaproteobacteria bacterium]